MMNVVILGLLYSDYMLDDAYKHSKSGVQMAPHLFQKRMIRGMQEQKDVNVSVINVPPIGSYILNYKRLLIKDRKWNDYSTEVGYLNIPIIKHIQQTKKIFQILKQKIEKDGDLSILIYSPYLPFLNAAIKLKEKYNNKVKICLLQTDPIPGIGDHEKYMSMRMIKLGKKIIKKAKKMDTFVVLTKQLAGVLEVDNRPYIVIECICDTEQQNAEKQMSDNICLYTGTTMAEYNIKDVVEAFKYIKNGQLWVCGYGDCDEYIKKLSKEYPHIKHFGMLKSEEVQRLRDECDFLINPRRPTGTYTKYSFPSKTAEYLMSGKPTILYKLEGIPDEYDKYVNYLNGNNARTIAMELEQIFSKNYLEMLVKAKRAREFMIKEKGPKIQCGKIIELMR